MPGLKQEFEIDSFIKTIVIPFRPALLINTRVLGTAYYYLYQHPPDCRRTYIPWDRMSARRLRPAVPVLSG
ncbi:MAG: hypothetical protein U1G07_18740 [Verrucomicrobiota bacterium]